MTQPQLEPLPGLPRFSIASCEAHEGEVLYRHSRTDETKFVRKGESLPSRTGEGGWFALVNDNTWGDPTQPLLIGRGLMLIAKTKEDLEVGHEINVISTVGQNIVKFPPGLYRITESRSQAWLGEAGLHVQVQYVGPLDGKRLVHLAGLANC